LEIEKGDMKILRLSMSEEFNGKILTEETLITETEYDNFKPEMKEMFLNLNVKNLTEQIEKKKKEAP
jgi:hypothetical protein